MMKISVTANLVFLLTGLSSLAQATEVYDQLFPYYVESCAVTRMQKKDGTKGGPSGHAVLYIKGLCRDEAAPFPKVRLCAEGEKNMADPDSGVGVSVNKEFSNINFEIIPTKSLFFYGNVTDDKLTVEKREAAKMVALEKGYYQNIKLHQEYLTNLVANAGASQTMGYVAEHSVDTDFGLAFARNSYCAHVPLKKKMLPLMRDYLNNLNAHYFYGTQEYQWKGLTNNCTHLTHNGVASLGFMAPVPTDDNIAGAIALGDVKAPENEVINLMLLTNRGFDVVRDFRNPYIRSTFEKFRWLPNQHGSTMEIIGGMTDNEIYVISDRSDPAPGCFTDPKCAGAFPWFRWPYLKTEDRYVTLKGNLLEFAKKYTKALANENSSYTLLYKFFLNKDETKQFEKFKEEYFSYLREQLQDVTKKLQDLR